MGLRESLQEGFEYDLWANQLWLEAIPRLEPSQRAQDVFGHIVRAQHIWLQRCLSEQEVRPLPEPPADALQALHDDWIEFLRISDPEAFVSYTLFSGESSFSTVEQIARLVVNHGTYHRGQLRGLADVQPLASFPETDLIRFYRQRQA